MVAEDRKKGIPEKIVKKVKNLLTNLGTHATINELRLREWK